MNTTLVRSDIVEPAPANEPVFGKILVAVDQFDPELSAAKLAAAIGVKSGAKIRVLHLRERESYGRRTFTLETSEEAQALVEAAVGELRRAGLEAEGSVQAAWVGRTWRAILDDAASWGADAIVIGTAGPRRLFGGRNRKRLMSKSSVPVLVAPTPSRKVEARRPTGEPATRRAA